MTDSSTGITRRRLLQVLAASGVGTAVFQRCLAAQAAQAGKVTPEMLQEAEWISGIELSEEDRESTAQRVNRQLAQLQQLRAVQVDYSVPPAVYFQADPGGPVYAKPVTDAEPIESAPPNRPPTEDQLAFLPVTELAALLRTRQVSSVELTKLYLKRLARYNPVLNCVVTFTEDVALKQAERADREIAAGRYRGPLHGVPWGAKDLIAWPGYPTTWGATPFEQQVLDGKATVAKRLENAGAVLVAKLSLGALAQGDRWFRGQTRNPWNPKQGSSGSSAGSAASTAAGLVGFTLGSETLGSIISPSKRCGTTGLRPTFGRVSRHGCMSLSWSMDKLGPICRSVEDCALVLAAIHGRDGLDPTAIDRPFHWPQRKDLSKLQVGFVDRDLSDADQEVLDVLRQQGAQLVPIELPQEFPVWPMTVILDVESATVFDELTRTGVDKGVGRWPQTFRTAQFVPAVDYLRANRVRTLLMQAMQQVFEKVDVYVGGNDLGITNLTGHPSIALPVGFQKNQEGLTLPVVTTLTGKLFDESTLLAVAHAYQQATTHHLKRPPLERWLEKEAERS